MLHTYEFKIDNPEVKYYWECAHCGKQKFETKFDYTLCVKKEKPPLLDKDVVGGENS